MEGLVALFEAIPWWVWLLLALAMVPAALIAATTALGLASATGANHHALTRRQRRMGRLAFFAASASVPLAALVGLIAAFLAVWPWLRSAL